MRVCFIVGEIFSWGTYGGFGALTRTLGKHLVKKGIEIYVSLLYDTPEKHKTIEILDNMVVITQKKGGPSVYKLCDADIYHSQDASLGAHYSYQANPNAKHLVTFQDPMYMKELMSSQWIFKPEWENPMFRINTQIRWKISEYLVKQTLNKIDALYSQAKFVIPKTMTMYNLTKTPSFLPNPVEIPDYKINKASQPTVCFLARWDPVKRIELFFELAKKNPDVNFIAMGMAHDKQRDTYLRNKYGPINNLELPGFVTETEKEKILDKSWVLINTSMRECLPISFLEASAHKCAILSNNNPDNFASEFGYYVSDENFSKGLDIMLKNDLWKEKGLKGHSYVKNNHELNKVVDEHIDVYNHILDDK